MLASSLAAALLVYGVGLWRLWRQAGYGRGVRVSEALAFGGGWLAVCVALSPPLDQLSDVWLTAHMVQHELLMVVAAPLMALSAPLIAVLWTMPAVVRRPVLESLRQPAIRSLWAALTAPASVFLLHAAALWVWHLPALYDYAWEHERVHVLQHLCFFGSAALFWWGIAHGRHGRRGYGAAVVFVFATAVHGGILGALLTVSPGVWYRPYAIVHRSGMTALEDQQLAGLLMWIPASLIFAAAGLVLFAAWLRESERRTRYPSAVPMTLNH
jgi:putative membrane protein